MAQKAWGVVEWISYTVHDSLAYVYNPVVMAPLKSFGLVKYPDLAIFTSLKPDTTLEQYAELFWAHAESKSVSFQGSEYDFSMPRKKFAKEANTKLFIDTKNHNELLIGLDECDMSFVAAVMLSPPFLEAAEKGWDSKPPLCRNKDPAPVEKPADGEEPKSQKSDLMVYVTLKEGTTLEEYEQLFWAHATSKIITVKGKEFTLDMTRSEFCDESKTRLFKNTKTDMELAIVLYDVDMEKCGAVMGSPAFSEAAALAWDNEAPKFLTAAPKLNVEEKPPWSQMKKGGSRAC